MALRTSLINISDKLMVMDNIIIQYDHMVLINLIYDLLTDMITLGILWYMFMVYYGNIVR